MRHGGDQRQPARMSKVKRWPVLAATVAALALSSTCAITARADTRPLARQLAKSPLLKPPPPKPFTPTAEDFEGQSSVTVPALEGALSRVTRQLEATAGWPAGTVDARVGDCGGYAAWATAPRTITVCRDALLFAATEDELAWLLGHEIGHLHLRHRNVGQDGVLLKESLVDSAWGAISVGLLVAAPPAILAMPAGHTRTHRVVATSEGAYSRNSELAADDFATGLLLAAGYSPRGVTRALGCLENQTTDCSPPVAASPEPVTSSPRGRGGLSDLSGGDPYSVVPTHPTFKLRRDAVLARVQRLRTEPPELSRLTWSTEAETQEIEAYRQLSLAADEVSREAQAAFADSMPASRRDVARRAACARRALPQKARRLLAMKPQGDRDVLQLAATVGMICGERDLALSQGRAIHPSFYQSLSHLFILGRFGDWSGYSGLLFRLAQTHAPDEHRYRQLRILADHTFPAQGASAALRGCKASPMLLAKARANTGFLSGTPESQVLYYCVPVVDDHPDFSPVNDTALLWFRSDPNGLREDRALAMHYRVNKAFQGIVEGGFARAGRPPHAFCPAGIEVCLSQR